MRKPTPKKRSPSPPLACGDLLAFRIPPDATDAELAFLNGLREQRKAPNEPYLGALFWEQIRNRTHGDEPKITVALPAPLTLEQQRLLGDEAIRRTLGYLVYQALGGATVSALTPPAPAPGHGPSNQSPLHDPALQNLLKGIYTDHQGE